MNTIFNEATKYDRKKAQFLKVKQSQVLVLSLQDQGVWF